MKKPKPQDILIPRLFDDNISMAGWALNLGYKYFMNAQGWIMYIRVKDTIEVEETMYGIDDYPLLSQIQKYGK